MYFDINEKLDNRMQVYLHVRYHNGAQTSE